jgi:hypothetical protein
MYGGRIAGVKRMRPVASQRPRVCALRGVYLASFGNKIATGGSGVA